METNRWVAGIYLIGVGVLLSGLAHVASVYSVGAAELHVIVDGTFLLGSAVGILYGATWHRRNPLNNRAYPRLMGWIALGGLLAGGLAVVTLFVGSDQVTSRELVEALHLAVSFGLMAGLLIGSVEGIATRQTEVAMRERTRANLLEEEREHFERLNELLRHYILNGVCIIDGYADRLRETLPPDQHEPIDAIQKQTRTMTTLTEHFKPLWALHAGHTRERLDLDAILAENAEDLADERGVHLVSDGDIGTHALPPETADSIELLLHALATVAHEGATLRVRSQTTDVELRLAITASPVSLSNSMAASLFEPIGTGTGLEFYLANQLVDRVGTLRLVERDGNSATVEYRLRTGPAQTAGGESPS